MGHDEINPWEWSKGFGFSQAIKVSEPQELLVCSGQTAMGPDGSLPESADMGDQACIGVLGPLVRRALGPSLPAMTLVGVTRLAFPELKIEIEVLAAR
jgi:enamine deaminase RidA (YjgF/YER057c/UK114 family)